MFWSASLQLYQPSWLWFYKAALTKVCMKYRNAIKKKTGFLRIVSQGRLRGGAEVHIHQHEIITTSQGTVTARHRVPIFPTETFTRIFPLMSRLTRIIGNRQASILRIG